ncbi:hypothetical protein V1514DRAFT_328564 [Lipomyces japonicus]|uniref:uncharacterized protein n=1 Tax=Lipomyces japonicus TaxID=56871 RepID=UPI0034CEA326
MANDGRRDSKVAAYIVAFVVSPEEYYNLGRVVAKCQSKANNGQELAPRSVPSTSAVAIAQDNVGSFFLSLWRLATRTFGGTYSILFCIEFLQSIKTRNKPQVLSKSRSRAARTAALIVASYRILFTFTTNINSNIYLPEARRFRRKHRRATRLLKSPLFPALTSGLASGLFLIHLPAGTTRSTITVYSVALAAEYLFNAITLKKQFAFLKDKVGVWIVFPFSLAQLIHTFVYDNDCCPPGFTNFAFRFAPLNISTQPSSFPSELKYPTHPEILDALRDITASSYPPFNSPILYPDSYSLPSHFKEIENIVSQAHPGISHLSCALIHPDDDSCIKSFTNFAIHQASLFSKYIAAAYAVLAIVKFHKLKLHPRAGLINLANLFVRSTLFLSMTTSTAWFGVCASQSLLPDKFIPTYRLKIIGFVAGLWAYVDQFGGKVKYMPFARMAIESYWKVLVKHGKIRPIRNGDVIVFAASFAVIMSIFDKSPDAIESNMGVKKLLAVISGRKLTDVIPASSLNSPQDEKQDRKN